MFKYKSKVGFSNKQTKSLRVGIPKEVVKFLKLEKGDSVMWKVEIENGDINVKIDKI